MHVYALTVYDTRGCGCPGPTTVRKVSLITNATLPNACLGASRPNPNDEPHHDQPDRIDDDFLVLFATPAPCGAARWSAGARRAPAGQRCRAGRRGRFIRRQPRGFAAAEPCAAQGARHPAEGPEAAGDYRYGRAERDRRSVGPRLGRAVPGPLSNRRVCRRELRQPESRRGPGQRRDLGERHCHGVGESWNGRTVSHQARLAAVGLPTWATLRRWSTRRWPRGRWSSARM